MADARKIDDYIAKAFIELGFTANDIKNGCWLLERENKKTGEMIKVAWIVYHKFLERAAQMAGIVFDEPKVFNLEPSEIALYVNGHKGDFSAWAIGEASAKNCKNEYRWAMAEKRAKDRVILKLLGVAGDVYSEEEADDFKQKPEKTEFEKQAAAEKTARTKALKQGKDLPAQKKPLSERFENAVAYLKSHNAPYTNSVIDSVNIIINDLYGADMIEQATELRNLFAERTGTKDDALEAILNGESDFKPYAI